MTLRVLVADDQQLVRAGFVQLIERDPTMTVVAEAADGAEAVALTRRLRPDVVLMDIRMPGLDGIDATRRITSDPTIPSRVVMLTTFETDDHLYDALRAGASGFLVKDIEPEELRRAITVVAAGDALLTPSVTRRLISGVVSGRAGAVVDPTPLADLTEREREVVALVAEGLSNHEIAERLFMSPATAKTHVSRALTKTGSRDRAQLVVLAYESGLVRPGG